jgi:hypothetical protein
VQENGTTILETSQLTANDQASDPVAGALLEYDANRENNQLWTNTGGSRPFYAQHFTTQSGPGAIGFGTVDWEDAGVPE